MDDGSTLKKAMNFAFIVKEEFGYELDRFSAQNHPNLPEAYRSIVAEELRKSHDDLERIHSNLKHNTSRDIKRVLKLYYRYYIVNNPKQGALNYIEVKKKKLQEQYGELFFNNKRKEKSYV